MATHQYTVKPRGRHTADPHAGRLAVVLTMVVLLIGVAVPAFAAKTVGTRLSLFGGDAPAAGEPFYVSHGFGDGDLTNGFDFAPWDFVLYVDGVAVKGNGVLSAPFEDGRGFFKVYNFPAGMTGVHTFEGHWYQACRAADSECDPGTPPGAMYESLVLRRTVDFGG